MKMSPHPGENKSIEPAATSPAQIAVLASWATGNYYPATSPSRNQSNSPATNAPETADSRASQGFPGAGKPSAKRTSGIE
jgi:hypothetical protein